MKVFNNTFLSANKRGVINLCVEGIHFRVKCSTRRRSNFCYGSNDTEEKSQEKAVTKQVRAVKELPHKIPQNTSVFYEKVKGQPLS